VNTKQHIHLMKSKVSYGIISMIIIDFNALMQKLALCNSDNRRFLRKSIFYLVIFISILLCKIVSSMITLFFLFSFKILFFLS